ncbi:MAG: GTP-binding protein [Rhodospirillaceae bacterium]|nr:GTP-binding protein [Rhodospirillaceae bacterium]
MSPPSPTPIPNARPDKIPVTVLTGFLGSGKTTILSHVIRRPELSDAAVIINEFGEISLDHELIERTDGDVIEIKGGCLCCTVRGDLIQALHDLLLKRAEGKVRAFNRIIIETTGLADPAPILHTLMSDPLAFDKFRLDGIVTTIDAVNGLATLDAHAEAVKQAAVADRVIVTKLDLVADGQAGVSVLRTRLAALNPGHQLTFAEQGRVDPHVLIGMGPFDPAAKSSDVAAWLRAEAYDDHGHHHHHDHDHAHDHAHDDDVNRHDAHIRAFCFTHDRPIPEMRLRFFLQLLGALRGADLLRVKGIVNVTERPEQPAVVHGVQHVFHPLAWMREWPGADRRSKLVFIVRDIAPEHIRELMNALTAAPEPATP